MASSAPKEEDIEEFLAPFMQRGSLAYRDASWLENSFDSPIWRIRCDSPFTIDWNVRLDDGELLTHEKHRIIWEVFRKILILQTHADVTGGAVYAPKVMRYRLQRAAHCIDYFLLRSKRLQLAEYGLSLLTANELAEMVSTLAKGRSIVNSVYEWPIALARHLRSLIAGAPQGLLDQTANEFPFLCRDIPDPDDRLTDLDSNEIVCARTCLWLRNAFTRGQGNGAGYSWLPSISMLTGAVYADTILGTSIKVPSAHELSLSPDRIFATEYNRARVYSCPDERMDAKLLSRYVSVIESMQLLDCAELGAIQQFERTKATANLALKSSGRFRTLPHAVVFTSLRRAVELLLEHGEAILDSFVSVQSAAKASGCSVSQYCHESGIHPHLTSGAKRLGITKWTIEDGQVFRSSDSQMSKPDYYRELRACTGLFETLRVVYGAAQIVVGTLMAQRSGALVGLFSQDCIDLSRTNLLISNAKSGHSGLQERIARPIPKIAIFCIELFERMQAALIEKNVISKRTFVFAPPTFKGDGVFRALSQRTYNESLDYFCDWIETPLDSEGRRYYIRQHQLRRFFAMLFFWGSGFGGMDTLRWFLGHTDVEHLWRYISEITPGATLRSVAAEYAAYGVKNFGEEAEILGDLIRERFGTSNFSVLEDEVLQAYIEGLIEADQISVEPQFLDGGDKYRIAVLLKAC